MLTQCVGFNDQTIYHDNIIIQGRRKRFGKGGVYRSIIIGKGSMISVYKIESSYVTIRKHRGAPALRVPIVPTPILCYMIENNNLHFMPEYSLELFLLLFFIAPVYNGQEL